MFLRITGLLLVFVVNQGLANLDEINHLEDIENPAPKTEDIQYFTDFLQLLITVLKLYKDNDLEYFAKVFDEEARKYYYTGCKFNELLQNYELRIYINNVLNSFKHTTAAYMRNTLTHLSDKLSTAKYNTNLSDLFFFINSLYKNESIDTFKKTLVSINDYRQENSKNNDLSIIVRDGIRAVIFDHYSSLHPEVRNTLKAKINEFWSGITQTTSLNKNDRPYIVQRMARIVTTKAREVNIIASNEDFNKKDPIKRTTSRSKYDLKQNDENNQIGIHNSYEDYTQSNEGLRKYTKLILFTENGKYYAELNEKDRTKETNVKLGNEINYKSKYIDPYHIRSTRKNEQEKKITDKTTKNILKKNSKFSKDNTDYDESKLKHVQAGPKRVKAAPVKRLTERSTSNIRTPSSVTVKSFEKHLINEIQSEESTSLEKMGKAKQDNNSKSKISDPVQRRYKNEKQNNFKAITIGSDTNDEISSNENGNPISNNTVDDCLLSRLRQLEKEINFVKNQIKTGNKFWKSLQKKVQENEIKIKELSKTDYRKNLRNKPEARNDADIVKRSEVENVLDENLIVNKVEEWYNKTRLPWKMN